MLVTVLTIAELIYVAVLAVWILLEKRSPAATLAWIFALIALPYVGFVVFFVLGPRRIRRKRLKHRRARESAAAAARRDHDEDAIQADPRVEQLVRLATRAGEPRAARCAAVQILQDGEDTFDAIEDAIRSARNHVHVAYYIFDPRRSGTRFRDALVERARAGVTVRLLVDHVGSSSISHKFLAPLLDAGAQFARFNEVRLPRFRNRIDFRMHRKIVVVDGVIGFTGGINVSDDYLPGDGLARERGPRRERKHERRKEKLGHTAPWRDTHVRLEGAAVRGLQTTFLDDWFFATGHAAREKELFPEAPTGDHLVQIVASGPDREAEAIQRLYFSAITSARTRVLVTTPYFVPDDAVITALETAALRGVDVRVLVPHRSDSLIVTAAARSYYDACIAAGVRIYEYMPTMIHAKTLVVDDFFAAVGTANLDNRSFRLNFEVTAVLYGPQYAEELAAHFQKDISRSREVKGSARLRVSLPWRLAEAGARVLSPLL